MAIRVELELNTGEFTTNVIRAGDSLRTLETRVGSTVASINRAGEQTRGFLSTMRDVSIVTGAAALGFNAIRGALDGWVGSIVRANAEMERTTALMKAMSTASNSVKDAANNVKYLRDMVKDAPFSFHALAESFTRMKSTGIDPMKGSMQALVDGVAAFGGSEDVLKRSSVALSQMAGKGVIQMEELRQQLGEAMPRATELMARAMGLSYGELVKKVSTGTLEAASSIQALNLEIERVYGGAARAQMQTFNGMLANTNALWQQLSFVAGGMNKDTGEAIPGGFMDTLKNQLRDLNTFMQSNAADVLAQRVGSALSQITLGLRDALDWTIRFRQELMQFAEVFAIAFTASKVIQWGGQFVNALSNARASVAALGTQLELVQRNNALASLGVQMSRMQSTMQNFGGTMATGISAIGRLSQVATFAGGAVRMIGAGFAMIGPWLPLITVGVLAVGDAFGLFSNKAKDAWQELEEFGVQSMKQVLVAKGVIDKMKGDLQSDENGIRIQADQGFGTEDSPDKARFIAEQEQLANLGAKRAEIAQAEAQWAKYAADAQELEAKKSSDAQMRELDRVLSNQQRQYDEAARVEGKAHETELSALAKAGKSKDAETTAYQIKQRAQALKFYDDQLALLNNFYDKARGDANLSKDERDDPGAVARAAAARASEKAVESRLQQVEAARAMQAAAPMGAVTISTPVSDDTWIKKGEKQLESLHAKIADMRAEINGATGDTDKLIYTLSHRQDGSLIEGETDQVRKLKEEMIAAQKEADELTQLLKGKGEMERDLDNIRIKALTRIAELKAAAEGRDLTDMEKFMIGANNGKYTGVSAGQNAVKVIDDGIRKFKEQTEAAAETGTTIQNNTFGATTLAKGQTMLEKITQIAAAWAGLKASVAGTNFGAAFDTMGGMNPNSVMNNSSATPMKGGAIYNQMLPEVAKAFLMAVQSVESGGAPNIRYGGAGGSKYFNDFSDHPRIKEVIPSGPNAGKTSDAAGTYQFLSSTWDSLGGGAFTPDRQEAMAWKLAQQDYARKTGGRSLLDDLQNGGMDASITGALGSTWEGFQKNSGKAIATYNKTITSGAPIASAQPAAGPMQTKVDEAQAADAARVQAEIDENYRKALEDLGIAGDKAKTALAGIGKSLKDTGDDADGAGKHVAALTAAIKAGKIDPNEKNPEAEKYRDLMKAAQDADREEAALAAKKKARNAANAAEEKNIKTKAELDARADAARKQIADPNSPKSQAGYIAFQADLDAQSRAYEEFYGKDSAEYKAHLASKQAMLQQYLNTTGFENAAKMGQDNIKLRQGLMTEGQARKASLDAQIAQLQEELRQSKLTGDARVEYERQVQAKIALLRQQYSANSPIQKQMKEWSAFGDNLEKAATGWLDSGVDAIANFVATGKMDFSSLAQSIISDITKIMLKAAIGNMMNKANGSGGKGAGKSGGGKSGGKSILKMFGFGAAHIGGIAGATSMSRSVSPLAFAGAPRFHTGGILSGMGLGPDEVPIIAKKGEGIFTPQQMKAMGQGGGVQTNMSNLNFAPSIVVNAAQGGDAKSNEDAAQRTAKAVEAQMRSLIGDEISKQLRPGNAIYNASKPKGKR